MSTPQFLDNMDTAKSCKSGERVPKTLNLSAKGKNPVRKTSILKDFWRLA
jgi:hypothetical protein